MGVSAYVAAARDAGAVAIHPEQTAATAELVSTAHGADLKVNVWTVNDHSAYEALAAAGVDNVFCDNPDFLA